MMLTSKQQDVWANTVLDYHRWNVSEGATRSGKTYLDYFRIPSRMREYSGKDGLKMLIGNTQATLERNVLEPMRNIWGKSLIGSIRNRNNEVELFGEKCYAVGADNIRAVDKIRGVGLAYCYGDEITTWSEPVFDMLKSRLDKPYSCFDGTCNPASPSHWFKKFLDSDADIYRMSFCIDDNEFLSQVFIDNLKKEYAGTVYYDRYINGSWVAAEGIIYKMLADDVDRYTIDRLPSGLSFGVIGVDFGGNKSGHSFTFSAFDAGITRVVTVADFYKQGIITPDELEDEFITFLRLCMTYGIPIVDIRADSAEQVLIAGLQAALLKNNLSYGVSNAIKGSINERIRLYTILLARDRWHIMKNCTNTIEAFRSALYDDKSLDDKRLDDGTTIIDPIDSQEYSTEPFADALLYGG